MRALLLLSMSLLLTTGMFSPVFAAVSAKPSCITAADSQTKAPAPSEEQEPDCD